MTPLTELSDEHFCNSVLGTIAQELGFEAQELQDDDFTRFADLGMNQNVAQITVSRIEQETKIRLPGNVFETYPDIDLFKQYLIACRLAKPVTQKIEKLEAINAGTQSQQRPGKASLSVLIRGSRSKASQKNFFLLPDGSGSALGYARIPSISPVHNLWALNSPFLEHDESRQWTVEELAGIWSDEIVSIQPHGPYVLGGWSAGGYYAFEVTKHFHRRGQTVEKLVLIDSPSRTKFEAMPFAVVKHLSTHNLMGNWGAKSETPKWLVNHFAATLKAVDAYTPVAISSAGIIPPQVYIIWAKDALLSEHQARETGLDLGIKVSSFLLERRDDFGPNGWELLFPAGTKLFIATMPGHHFNIVHPPQVEQLGRLLSDLIQQDQLGQLSKWRAMEII